MLTGKDIVSIKDKPPVDLPYFGMKDFQPDGSLRQSSEIENSLLNIKEIVSQKTVKSLNTLSQAIWRTDLQLAEVTQCVGSYWTYMGHKIENKLFLYPEEALYLLETGSLEITYCGVPLSAQRAYFLLLKPKTNISVQKYRVYALLNNHGYKVLRHSPLQTVTNYEKKLDVHKLGLKLKDIAGVGASDKRKNDFSKDSFENKKLKCHETLTFPVVIESNEDQKEILKKIQVIQSFNNVSPTDFNFDYDIYSEKGNKQSGFKKSCLQLPNFRVIIHRGEDYVPDLKELSKLTYKYEDEVPVIHAIVFSDSISFYKINPVVLPDAID